jgi:hypothetical protein
MAEGGAVNSLKCLSSIVWNILQIMRQQHDLFFVGANLVFAL